MKMIKELMKGVMLIKDSAICSNGVTVKNINKTRIVNNLEKKFRSCSVKYLENISQIKKGGRSSKLATL